MIAENEKYVRNFMILLKLCFPNEIIFIRKFLSEFISVHSYAHNLIDLDILANLKTTKNIERYLLNNFTAKELFEAIDCDSDQKYVLDTLVNLILKS